MDTTSCANHCGLSNIARDRDSVSKYYDEWAPEYDADLARWRYEAPEQAASLLCRALWPAGASSSTVMDAGCGTGLSGKALHSAGFTTIDGIDVSRRSLDIAGSTGVYRRLHETDMQRLPFPIGSDQYDGLVCVGVMTYLTDTTGTLREFGRMVKSGGTIVMSQRSDLLIERNFAKELESLSSEGVFTNVHVSEPRPYLPENDEFGDKLLVHYVSCQVV